MILENLENIVPAISAGARNEELTSTDSCLLMLGIILTLIATAIVVAKVRKEI